MELIPDDMNTNKKLVMCVLIVGLLIAKDAMEDMDAKNVKME